jgi:3-oxoacyl-[acyl-carrier-protein] synthase-1
MIFNNDYSSNKFIMGKISFDLPELPYLNLMCNRILAYCYEEIREQTEYIKKLYGSDRIGVVLGSSNGGINDNYSSIKDYFATGHWNFELSALDIGTPSEFLSKYAAVTGPSYTISTACSSSAKAFASARSLIRSGLCDAVILGGADSLSDYTVNGFDALEAMSAGHTNPFSKNRDGINIGEGGALFIMTKEDFGGEGIILAGTGESSDSYHMTSPDPEGKGAYTAMTNALKDASLSSDDIDYINLHGTGTISNDSMESAAVNSLFGADLYAGSTKPMTGHTLGACGAIEAAFCWLILSPLNKTGQMPVHVWDGCVDKSMPPLRFVNESDRAGRLNYCLSNSFAFGGSNACVVLGKC